jgi:hypothetical protein
MVASSGRAAKASTSSSTSKYAGSFSILNFSQSATTWRRTLKSFE